MRDEDKPFVCYKQGWSIKIVPRNSVGWQAMGLWVFALLPLMSLFLAYLAGEPGPTGMAVGVTLFVVATLVWVFAMIRWMMARSEVVEMDDLLRLKRELDRQRGRGGRRRS